MIISRQKGPVGCSEVRLSHDGRGGRGTKINGERERESINVCYNKIVGKKGT